MTRKIGRGAMLGRYIAKSIHQYSTPEFKKAVKSPSYIRRIKKIFSFV
jgi:hypothetical protein